MGEIQPSQHCNTKCSVIIDRGQFRAVNGKKHKISKVLRVHQFHIHNYTCHEIWKITAKHCSCYHKYKTCLP